MTLGLRLSKAGYGSLKEVLDWDSETFITALEYESFVDDLTPAFIELNKEIK